MNRHHARQLRVFSFLIALFGVLTFVAYAAFPTPQLPPTAQTPASAPHLSLPMFALAAAVVALGYGLFGLAGYWFAGRLGLPSIYREQGTWREWLAWPAGLGAAVGLLLIIGDRLFGAAGQTLILPHPAFPFSVIASAAAAIGEEILFRSFVLGLWAFLLAAVLRRWNRTAAALWAGVLIAALAFSAAHLPAAMVLFGVTTPGDLPPLLLAEFMVLNTLLGVAAGERYLRDGLVAAIGLHFWADIVWHVVGPLLLHPG